MTMRAPIHDLHRSNLVTYLSLVSGMGAIAMARSDGVPLAGVALAVSAIADTFDGRFARRFSRTARQARIGHELDSLVDAVVFGAAPVVVVASRLSASGSELFFAWAAASVYLVAVVTRLAYYNVQKDDGRFVGVPAPAAALICATSLLVPVSGWPALWPLLAGAVLMVSPIPLARPRRRGLLAFAGWAVALVVLLALRAANPG